MFGATLVSQELKWVALRELRLAVRGPKALDEFCDKGIVKCIETALEAMCSNSTEVTILDSVGRVVPQTCTIQSKMLRPDMFLLYLLAGSLEIAQW